MPYQVSFKQGQLSDLVGHLERLRNYYAAEAAVLSRAAMTREWDGKAQQFAMELITERMSCSTARRNCGSICWRSELQNLTT